MNIYEVFIMQPIFNMLIAIYGMMPWGDIGIAIILFTILVRFALYPLVKRQLHQTKKMRKLQPQLKKIKKAAGGNKQVEALQMMELYKRHGVSPMRSIGILLIQLPIFIALFHSIRVFTDHRDEIAKFTYDFLEGFGPIKSLIEDPNQFNEKLFGVIDLTQHAIGTDGIVWSLVLLALLSSVTQFFMSKQTMPSEETPKKFKDIMREAAEGKQADQAEMNAVVMRNMIKVMPIMLFFIMINLPGALALYYTVSNLIAVAQQAHLLRQDEEELEEIADEIIEKGKTDSKKPKTSAATRTREKQAKNAQITRITAKDNKRGGRRKN